MRKNYLGLLFWVTVGVLFLVEPSLASPSSAAKGIFGSAQTKANDAFMNIRLIVFLVGGFGIIGLAFAAIFGKVHFRWGSGLAFGLFVLAVTASVISFVTGADVITSGDTID